jgi:catechol 2,3-dioxygenase-like lactoylglutathione lyase family enzyme
MVMKLNHVALTVGDRERSALFYEIFFGMTERVHDDRHLLVLASKHVSVFQDVPRVHSDPFDRLFVAQAISDGMILLTADKALVDLARQSG